MPNSEKFCLRWSDFKENVNSAFALLRKDTDFTDVTLACEDGYQVDAHKAVLVASSPFFNHILKRNKHAPPLIYMRGMKPDDLLAIVDFLYYGETNIYQENLDTFLLIAEDLQLKGLSGLDKLGGEGKGDGVNPMKQPDRPPVASIGTQRNNDTVEIKKIQLFLKPILTTRS